MRSVTLLTGGSRSGKSRHALEIASKYNRKAFIATAEPMDDEMRTRIMRHREERGADFVTVEEPVDLAGAVHSIPPDVEVAVIDCLTVWLGNLMHRFGEENEGFAQVDDLLETLRNPPCDLIIVTNEVGMGIIPDNRLGRRYRDMAGNLNQRVAGTAGKVVLLVSGIPVVLKDGEQNGF